MLRYTVLISFLFWIRETVLKLSQLPGGLLSLSPCLLNSLSQVITLPHSPGISWLSKLSTYHHTLLYSARKKRWLCLYVTLKVLCKSHNTPFQSGAHFRFTETFLPSCSAKLLWAFLDQLGCLKSYCNLWSDFPIWLTVFFSTYLIPSTSLPTTSPSWTTCY